LIGTLVLLRHNQKLTQLVLIERPIDPRGRKIIYELHRVNKVGGFSRVFINCLQLRLVYLLQGRQRDVLVEQLDVLELVQLKVVRSRYLAPFCLGATLYSVFLRVSNSTRELDEIHDLLLLLLSLVFFHILLDLFVLLAAGH